MSVTGFGRVCDTRKIVRSYECDSVNYLYFFFNHMYLCMKQFSLNCFTKTVFYRRTKQNF